MVAWHVRSPSDVRIIRLMSKVNSRFSKNPVEMTFFPNVTIMQEPPDRHTFKFRRLRYGSHSTILIIFQAGRNSQSVLLIRVMLILVNRPRTNSKYNFIILKTAATFVGNDCVGMEELIRTNKQTYNLCTGLLRSFFPTEG